MKGVAPPSLPDGTQLQQLVRVSTENTTPSQQAAELDADLLSVSNADFFAVFTPECLSVPMTEPCHPNSVGKTCILKTDFPSFTPEGDTVYWSLGQQITDAINPSFPSHALDILQVWNCECETFQYLAIQGMLPVANVKIYCPPCACAIRSALTICKNNSSDLIKYIVRVDERLPCSCCPYSTVVETITSLLQTMQLTESDQLGRLERDLNIGLLKHLDRQWIEKMLYQLESKPPQLRSKTSLIQRVGQLVCESASKISKAVFICEMDYLRPVLEMSAFPKLPRPPRVNEIYRMQKSSATLPWKIDYLGTFTPKNFKAEQE